MKPWNTAARFTAAIGALLLIAGLGSAVHGQARADRTSRALDVMAGRGSEIGVSVRDVEGERPNAASARGVLIEDVVPDGPAAKAGVRKGDVIVEFDGERVRSVRQFVRLVDETPARRRVPALLMRGTERVEVAVEPRAGSAIRLLGNFDSDRIMRDLRRELGDGFSFAPPPPPPAAPDAPPMPPVPPVPGFEGFGWGNQTRLGIRMSALTPQLAEYFGTKRGVLVTSVEESSPAEASGFKAGDVVTAFDGAEVSEPADLRRRIQRLQNGDEFTAEVLRQKKPLTLKGKIEGRAGRAATRVAL
ncbi:MAG: serine protease Do [Acidobacteriota bacterium]|jgi:serine protease Do